MVHRVLIVDDHGLFREGVARLLDAELDLNVAGQCSTVDDALNLMRTERFDLVLLDMDLGQERGTRLVLESRRVGYRGKYLVVTAGIPQSEAGELIRLGVRGVFLK